MLKKITHHIIIGSLFLIPIFPLLVANSYFFPFITGKAFYFRILVEIAFAAWIVLACLDAKYRPKINTLTIGVTLFALVAFLADLLGMNPIRSIWSNFERMEGWMTIIHLWAFFIVAMSVFGAGEEGKKMWHRWLNASLAVALIVAGYAFLQFMGVLQIQQSSDRVDATLGNAAYIAVYMLFQVFIASYFFFVRAQKKEPAYSFLRWIVAFLSVASLVLLFETIALAVHSHMLIPLIVNIALVAVLAYILYKWRPLIMPAALEWMYSALMVVFSFILLETQTRGTILGLVGGFMLALFLYAIFGKNELKSARWISGGLIILVIILSGIFWIERHSALVQNNDVLNRIASISLSDTQTQARAYIWPMALTGFTQRPILGWGQENFNYIFNANYNPKMWSQEQWFDRAHSVFLDWLVAAGGVGLIAYLALYVLFLTAVWKSSMTIAEKSVLTGLIAAYAVHNVFVFDNLASYAMFFALLGFAGSLQGGKDIKWLGTNPLRLDAVEYIVAPIVIIVVAIGIYFIDVRNIQANTDLIAALSACSGSGNNADAGLFQKALNVNSPVGTQEIREQLLECGGSIISGQYPAPTKEAFYNLTVAEINAQIAATPKDARIYTLAGSFYNSIAQYGEAQTLLEKAHALSPGKQTIDFELATAYLANAGNDPTLKDKSVALMKTAYESATDDPTSKQAYAISLVIDGKESQARAMFDNDPAIFDTDQMANVYVSLKQYPQAMDIYQKLIAADSTNADLYVSLARIQYTAGMISQSKQTLRSIEKFHPEYTSQIEAAIKSVK